MFSLAELPESRRHMSDIPAWREACRCAVSDGVPRRSFLVALVVGAVLNLINQGDALLAGARPLEPVERRMGSPALRA